MEDSGASRRRLRRWDILFRRYIEPICGRRPVLDSEVSVPMRVTITSSADCSAVFSSRDKSPPTDIVLQQHLLIPLGRTAHLSTFPDPFAHLPIPIPQRRQRRHNRLLHLRYLSQILHSLPTRALPLTPRTLGKKATTLTLTVKSLTPVPRSCPSAGFIPTNLISAKNSGKLRKHTPRRPCRPSLSSLSLRPARLPITSSHHPCSADRALYVESARKVCL